MPESYCCHAQLFESGETEYMAKRHYRSGNVLTRVHVRAHRLRKFYHEVVRRLRRARLHVMRDACKIIASSQFSWRHIYRHESGDGVNAPMRQRILPVMTGDVLTPCCHIPRSKTFLNIKYHTYHCIMRLSDLQMPFCSFSSAWQLTTRCQWLYSRISQILCHWLQTIKPPWAKNRGWAFRRWVTL